MHIYRFCDCKNWMKVYKCSHIIALASRLRKCNFADIPIRHKRKQGRPAGTAKALLRQPNEAQPEAGVDEYPSSAEETIATTVLKRKRNCTSKLQKK